MSTRRAAATLPAILSMMSVSVRIYGLIPSWHLPQRYGGARYEALSRMTTLINKLFSTGTKLPWIQPKTIPRRISPTVTAQRDTPKRQVQHV